MRQKIEKLRIKLDLSKAEIVRALGMRIGTFYNVMKDDFYFESKLQKDEKRRINARVRELGKMGKKGYAEQGIR